MGVRGLQLKKNVTKMGILFLIFLIFLFCFLREGELSKSVSISIYTLTLYGTGDMYPQRYSIYSIKYPIVPNIQTGEWPIFIFTLILLIYNTMISKANTSIYLCTCSLNF